MTEAQCSVIGGHSIRNDDIHLATLVTASSIRSEFGRNVGSRAGDILLLTKPSEPACSRQR